MEQQKLEMSLRLTTLANMVSKGLSVVDVGCDHGFLSIYLIQNGICPHVIAMDVRRGPLSKAEEHVKFYGLNKYIQTRLSDGLKEFKLGEADACVCAGMGGPLMAQIISESSEKAHSFKEMILQPQSELEDFRDFLIINKYLILDEEILVEEGKYYFIFKVKYSPETEYVHDEKDELYKRFGRNLLEKKHPVLKEYLLYRMGVMQKIRDNLKTNDNPRARIRYEEICLELKYIEEALNMFD